MLLARRFSTLLIPVALFVGACSGGTPEPKLADVKAGSMPDGGEWTGVYFDKVRGFFHLVQNGGTLSGKWRREHGERWGELRGECDANLCKFSWNEYDTSLGAMTPTSSSKGKGYFLYSRPDGSNVDDRLEGQVGYEKDEVGEKISAVKQRNVPPDLDSIGSSTGASDIGGGDWDKSDEGGTPEAPSPPKKDKEPPPPL
jgi:hypothetical protein